MGELYFSIRDALDDGELQSDEMVAIEQTVLADAIVDESEKSSLNSVTYNDVTYENLDDKLRLTALIDPSVYSFATYQDFLQSRHGLSARMPSEVIKEVQGNIYQNGSIARRNLQQVPKGEKVAIQSPFVPDMIHGEVTSTATKSLIKAFEFLPEGIGELLKDAGVRIEYMNRPEFDEATMLESTGEKARGAVIIDEETGSPTILVRNDLTYYVGVYVLIHEIGHALLYTLQDRDMEKKSSASDQADLLAQSLYRERMEVYGWYYPLLTRLPTHNASQNYDEWFADAFAFYVLSEQNLAGQDCLAWLFGADNVFAGWKGRDPVVYLMMRELAWRIEQKDSPENAFSSDALSRAEAFYKQHPDLLLTELDLWDEKLVDQNLVDDYLAIFTGTESQLERIEKMQFFLEQQPHCQAAQDDLAYEIVDLELNDPLLGPLTHGEDPVEMTDMLGEQILYGSYHPRYKLLLEQVVRAYEDPFQKDINPDYIWDTSVHAEWDAIFAEILAGNIGQSWPSWLREYAIRYQFAFVAQAMDAEDWEQARERFYRVYIDSLNTGSIFRDQSRELAKRLADYELSLGDVAAAEKAYLQVLKFAPVRIINGDALVEFYFEQGMNEKGYDYILAGEERPGDLISWTIRFVNVSELRGSDPVRFAALREKLSVALEDERAQRGLSKRHIMDLKRDFELE